MLCSNRPEGFGPHSALSSPIPTTCFVDTILMPLPVWLGLALLPLLLLLSLHHRKATYNPSTRHLRARPLRSCLHTTATAVYYVLILCNVLMQTLEIVRLALIHVGPALLPFAYVGLLLGAALHWSEGLRGRVRGWQAVNGILWLGGTVVSVVKVVGLVNMGIDARKGSKYPVSDQVIDVAVMAGVYAMIGILEAVLAASRGRRTARGEGESVGSGSPGPRQQQLWVGK